MSDGLRVQGLTVTAPIGGPPVAVLRDVTFSIAPGQVLGIVGESGAGKSMLGKVVARRLPDGFRVATGALSFGGRDLLAAPEREVRRMLGRQIAFVPQEPSVSLNPVRSVGRQFGEHLARLDVPAHERRARMIAALDEVGLADPGGILKRFAHQLSGGECQRVLIALAFSSHPALVVADEPTTALDVTTQATIVALLRRLQSAHGTAVLFITHDLRLAGQVCDDVMVLYAGAVAERGPARAVLGTPGHPYTRALLQANPALGGARLRLRPLRGAMPSLGGVGLLSGCRFAARCPVDDVSCRRDGAPWRWIGPGHGVACAPACEAAAAGAQAELLPVAPPPTEAPILAVDGLGKTFRSGGLFRRTAAVEALAPVSFKVAPGEFVGIVGESGSGKSTLARLLVGLERPSMGTISVDGADVTAATARNRRRRRAALQMVFQDPHSALNPRRTVADIVTQALEVAPEPVGRRRREERAAELLGATGLSADLGRRYPSQLSGGQKQRVNIARALGSNPRILVADEIVSGLDVSVQAQLLNLLLRLREERGIAVILISHDLSVVRYLCERVMVLRRGIVVESGRTQSVFADPQSDYTRLLLASCPPDPVPDEPSSTRAGRRLRALP